MKLVAVLVLVASCGGDNKIPVVTRLSCDTPTFGTTVELRRITQLPSMAILVTSPPRDSRLFVVQLNGQIRVIENEVLHLETFLDLSPDAGGPVLYGGENGLLGMAFHPQYATNGVFFVTYTARNPGDPLNAQRDVLARCTVSATDPNRADAQSCVEVISIPDLADNHNGGMIEFGADGYLYWGTGDGGSGNPNNPQALEDGEPNVHALFGKILRLDVDTKTPGLEYGIPADNPFAAGGGRPEIWIRGLRNPWRWSFDRLTGDIWIGDVGQKLVEELDVLRPSKQAGANLGWKFWEGSICYEGDCTSSQTMAPRDERLHADGWYSIIGGQVYRGSCFPDLQGTYFYTDHYRGGLSTAKLGDDDTLTTSELPGNFPPNITSIHEDAAGELYATDIHGNIFQLIVTAP